MSETPDAAPILKLADGEIVTVFKAQRATALALRTSTAKTRIEKLQRLEVAVLAHREAIYQALAADLHRSEAETDFLELLPVIAGIRHARRHLTSWMKPKRVLPTMMLLGTKARIRHEPKGVSLIIAPWNYPISLLLRPLTSAIAAGCPAIVKPSELTPACSAILTTLVRATFEPAEVAAFEGDAAVSTALLELPFDHIFFTGSPGVGKIVMAAAAKHLASVTLELGGKSPVIVDESADIAKAAKSIAWAKFSNCGQTCVAPDHAYVHESRMPQFIEAMKDAIARTYGNAMQSPDYCRIINGRNFERVSHLIDDAVAHGAVIVAGGERDEAQKFIAPTLLSGVSNDAAIMREEIFGPVLPIVAYRDLADPIAAINARPKPLALYIYAKDHSRANRVIQETSAGGTCINAAIIQFSHENLPFGGIGNSGLGNSHGFYGFRAFSHERAVLEDKFSLVPLLFPPYTPRVKRMIKWTVRFFT
jgi:aldehyde dehydrogenase (NAD+)